MELPDFNDIQENEPSNIALYPYKHLDAYLKTSTDDPKYHWHSANLLGEMYEYLMYERLLNWANDIDEINEFVLKGPYVNRNPTVKNGLVYDSKNQIFYMSNGETIGEFDALFKYGKYRYFVEIIQTDNKRNIRPIKYELERKYNLFRILFPNDEVRCWIITTYRGNINPGRLPNIIITRTPKYDLDPNILSRTEGTLKLLSTESDKFKTVYQLVYDRFDYFHTLIAIHRQLKNVEVENFEETALQLVSPYIGIIERVFLGKLIGSTFNEFLLKHQYSPLRENLDIKSVYPTLKIKGSSSVSKTIYLSGGRNSYYEMTDLNNPTVKGIQPRKRATRDLKRLDKFLKQLNVHQVEQSNWWL